MSQRNKRLESKVAIVTGGGSGIGRAICNALAIEGAQVVVADLNERSAIETCDGLNSMRAKCLPMKVDVKMEDQVERLVDETVKNFGRVDILCANAGISKVGWVVDITEEDWDLTMDVNLKGIFLCCKHAARQMIKQGKGGKIVNTASQAGKTGEALNAHYSASKFGVVGFTMALADELAQYKINVNAICPGFVDTSLLASGIELEAKIRGKTAEKLKQSMIDVTPLGRLEKPEEVAKLVVFLTSEDSDFMTGQSINITGGHEKH